MSYIPGKPLRHPGLDHLWIHNKGSLRLLSVVVNETHHVPCKVAVHITGVIRGPMDSLLKHIISELRADVFINASNYSNQDCFGLNPKIVMDSTPDSTNTLTMFKRMDELQDAFDEYITRTSKRYDVVIRTRPDIMFREPIPMSVIQLAARGVLVMFTKQHMKYIYNPRGSQLYTDTIFLSNTDTMRAVHHLYRERKDSIDAVALGEMVITSFIRSLNVDVYVLMGFEILIQKMALDRFSLGNFVLEKLKCHWPL